MLKAVRVAEDVESPLLQAMPSLKERAKTLIELISSSYFIFADRPLELEPKASFELGVIDDHPDALRTGGPPKN